MDTLKKLIKTVDDLPLIAKIILAIPAIDIIWCIYRVLKSLTEENYIGVILGAVLIFVGIPFMWLIDILCIIFRGNIWWF